MALLHQLRWHIHLPASLSQSARMPSIRPVSLKKFERFLLSVGCEYVRKKGSHRIYDRSDLLRPVIVPEHGHDISAAIIRSNLRTLGVSPEEYLMIINDI